MVKTLAARATDFPLPTGIGYKKFGSAGGAQVAWPGGDAFIYPGTGVGGDTIAFNRPERFWLKAGAFCIHYQPSGNWVRYDYGLVLVVNGVYGAGDLNGIALEQKANGAGGGTSWWGTCIEALFYCEANTNYTVDFVSRGGGAGGFYYQQQVHWNLWAYTIGEGVY